MTLTQLYEFVKADVQRWMSTPSNKKLNLDEPLSFFNGYLKGEQDAVDISVELSSVQNWYILKFENEALEGRLSYDLLALNAYYGLWQYRIGYGFGKVYPGKQTFLMNWFCNCLSTCWMLGWTAESRELGTMLVTELSGKHFKGGSENHLYPWFTYELFCRWASISPDTAATAHPKDMGVYANALKQWNTSDPAVVDKLVTELCDYHLANAADNDDAEFDLLSYFVFPVEILGWLSLRRQLGLQNPQTFIHPLMQLPINQLPPAVPLPEDALFQKVVLKIRKEYPAITA